VRARFSYCAIEVGTSQPDRPLRGKPSRHKAGLNIDIPCMPLMSCFGKLFTKICILFTDEALSLANPRKRKKFLSSFQRRQVKSSCRIIGFKKQQRAPQALGPFVRSVAVVLPSPKRNKSVLSLSSAFRTASSHLPLPPAPLPFIIALCSRILANS
jgi:hypothetical protein